MKRLAAIMVLAAMLAGGIRAEGPSVSFGGYLDSDVWTDFSGNFFSNDELDLCMGLGFSEKVSIDLCATVASGSVPAGGGLPGGETATRYALVSDTFEIVEGYTRWVDIAFDGITLTYESPVGTFAVGDLVYQYGGFNYYFYKRLSMITTENFTRGLQYSIGNDKVSQSILFGSADMDAVGDVGGATVLSLMETHSVGLFYGIRGSVMEDFADGTTVYAGLEYNGAFGEALSAKLDVGYQNLPGSERAGVVSLLAEPTLTVGKFSTALSVYALIDPDSANDLANDPLFGLPDEMFVYIEPGIAINDVIGVGLPLEYHAYDMEASDDDEFWAVPTLYVTPVDGVQWWVWGQVVAPLADNSSDIGYGLGSEVIVEF